MAHKKGPAVEGAVRIELDPAQVNRIIRMTSGSGPAGPWPLGMASVIPEGFALQLDDRKMSRSLVLGLMVYSFFPRDHSYLRVSDISRSLDLTSSTVHRYISTLLAVGLLEREPNTRRYRLAE
jgi:IclR helix-turn-helix domain